MTETSVDHELARLLSATRAATEPDANARARVRAALAVGLAGAGPAKVGLTARVGGGARPWLLSAFLVAVLVGVTLLRWPAAPPAPAPTRASTPASPESVEQPSSPALAPASPRSAVSDAVAAPSASALAQRRASLQPLVASHEPARAVQAADELALVSAMQLALRSGNSAQALALASEHARRFPAGALVQEREGARAIARCQLAEPAARAAIQGAFEAGYAGSPYAARVKAACVR